MTHQRRHASEGGRGHRGRRTEFRTPRKVFLVVCEGQQTEPIYFRKLCKELGVTATVEIVGTGRNTRSLVEEAARIRDRQPSPGYDEVWCVFDRDSFRPEEFNAALQLAERLGFKSAYSNEAFELWYLLHFDYHTSAMSRSLYADKLTRKLGFKYEKNSEKVYEAISQYRSVAISNARRLRASYRPHRPEIDNPSTAVDLLVSELESRAVGR